MKTAVGLIYYNDVKSLQRLIPTIAEHFDHIIAVDGIFSMLKGEGEDYSTDGSTEYLKTIDNVILKKFVGMEFEKRNVYLDVARELGADILFMIDSDEYVIEGKGWDFFNEELEKILKSPFPIWAVRFVHHGVKATSYARIYTNLDEIKYSGSHCVFDINGHLIVLTCDPLHFMVSGIRIQSDDFLRSPVWEKKVKAYQQELMKVEKDTRKKAQVLVTEGQNKFINIKDVLKQ